MKFTAEDLMKAMGLQVGDRISINSRNDVYIIELNECDEPIYIEEYTKIKFPLFDLINKNVKILPRPKRVGDMDINDKDIYYKYKLVPLLDYKSNLCDWGIGVPEPKNLYEVLEHWQKYNKDQEIYDLLKARLDKEVKE